MSSPPQSIPIGKKAAEDDSSTSHSSRQSSFAPGTSPFRQASLRLGSPVPSLGAQLNRPNLNADDENNDEAIADDEEEEFEERFQSLPGDHIRVPIARRASPAMSFNSGVVVGSVPQNNVDSSAQSVRSIDINNPDPEVVKVVGRHLVKGDDSNVVSSAASSSNQPQEDKFASLKLQGGDITRQLYNWQREHEEGETSKRGRSRSFEIPRELPKNLHNEAMDINNIKAPGGFRRNFLLNKAHAQDPESLVARPTFLTRNFIEFLSIYGHFSGEYLEEDDDDEDESSSGETDETTALLGGTGGAGGQRPGGPTRAKSRRKSVHATGNATPTKAVMLLLKSFVGTGVLFLPHAFYNGGILFSSLVLAGVSALSYWCFLLLIRAKDEVGGGSFGDVGGVLYGPRMRQVILASIVLSQIGFAAAYFVFTSENLQAMVLAMTDGKTTMSIESLILIQLVVFLPLSWVRDIAKLSGTALIADAFILAGLVYLYFWGIRTLALDGIADIALFNPDLFTLFIGTAIFTYEGVGLIIPIQESMKNPAKFTPVLGGVMIGITVIFVSMGAISYAAYGSATKTVVILNLPQDSGFVNAIQLLYSLAIVLSTPLQLFPAIRILENGLFVRSGKFNKKVKWQKNIFRVALVLFTAVVAWVGSDDLDKFVSLIGSFACIPLVYIYPPMLHLKARGYRSYVSMTYDIAVIALGFGAMIFTTWSNLQSWVSKD